MKIKLIDLVNMGVKENKKIEMAQAQQSDKYQFDKAKFTEAYHKGRLSVLKDLATEYATNEEVRETFKQILDDALNGEDDTEEYDTEEYDA